MNGAADTVKNGLMKKIELAEHLRVSVRQLEHWIKEGKVPQPIRISRHPRWRRAEVDAWLESGCPPLRTADDIEASSRKTASQ